MRPLAKDAIYALTDRGFPLDAILRQFDRARETRSPSGGEFSRSGPKQVHLPRAEGYLEDFPPPVVALRSFVLTPLIVAVALFMENLDSTIIATSLPVIARDLKQDPVALKLAMTSYLLA